MQLTRTVLLALLFVFAVQVTPAWAQVKPWVELPWSEEGLTLEKGGDELAPAGPSALGVGPGFVVVANAASSKLAHIGMDKKVRFEEGPFAAVDVAVDGRGALGLLNTGLDQIAWLEPGMPWQIRPLEKGLPGAVRLAWDEKDGLWVELADGTVRCVTGCEENGGKRVLPMPGGVMQAWSRLVDPHKVVLWAWPAATEASFKAPEARRFQWTDSKHMGLVRAIGWEAGERMICLLEFLAEKDGLQVTGEVRLLNAAGTSEGSVFCKLDNAAPVYRWAAADASGNVWVMRVQSSGLKLYRFESKALAYDVEVP